MKTPPFRSLLPTVAAAFALLTAPTLPAQTYTPAATLTSLAEFTSVLGFYADATPTQGTDGAFYGVTQFGGPANGGTVYRRASNGAMTVLHYFGVDPNDGASPTVSMVQAPDGFFYGATSQGGVDGDGVVFKISADGTTYSIVHTFSGADGANPAAALVVGQDGYLYGTTTQHAANGVGNIFLVSTDGTLFVDLYDFNSGVEGNNSQTPLVQGPDGTFYGANFSGGNSGNGTVFALTVSGTAPDFTGAVRVVYGFNGPSDNPVGSLVLDSGTLYGTAFSGGTESAGTVFSVSTDGNTVADPLYSFNYSTDGGEPYGGLTLVNGLLYGTCSQSGPQSQGTVFSLAEDGTGFQVLHSFDGVDGNTPQSSLVLAADGTLYGACVVGGPSFEGTLFQISTDGSTFNTLFSFYIDHSTPDAAVIQGTDGAFYGTTYSGGVYGVGTVFRVDSTGSVATLHDFQGTATDGSSPSSALVLGQDGFFYGTTQGGGIGAGTAFKISTDGTTFTILHNFGTVFSGDGYNVDGTNPCSALIQGADGFFYGTARYGGANDDGTVFQLSADGSTFNVLHTFDRSDGAFPVPSLVQGADGFLYGVTQGGGDNGGDGTIFKVSTDGMTFKTLRMLNQSTDGAQPAGALVQDPGNGLFYGATQDGGPGGAGTVFQIAGDGTDFVVLNAFAGGELNSISNVEAGLTLSKDGYLYGTTTFDGANGYGTVFRLSTGGDFAVLYDLTRNSSTPPYHDFGAILLEGDDGFFYGVATQGGLTGYGLIYQLAVTPVVDGGAIAGQVGTALTFQVPAFHNPTAFSAVGLPPGLSIGATTGVISGTPAAAGTSTATVTATNTVGSASAQVMVTILPLPPAITSGAPPMGQVGQAYAYQVTASHNPTSFAATGLPAGLAIDANTGLVSGTPTGAGSSDVTFTATNSGGTGTATDSISIVPPAPVITSGTAATTQAGVAFSYQIAASNSPTNFSASGLPAGLGVNDATGLISGTPTIAGTYTITLGASNAGGSAMATLTLTVTAATVPLPRPVINSPTTAAGTVGQPFTYTITASNGATSYGSSALPAGLALNPATGVISGTPTVAGGYRVTISATNATGTVAEALTITVSAAPAVVPAPVITSPAAVTVTAGQPFTYQITATNSPARYAAASLPAGLVVDTVTGLISGTPSAAGTFNIGLSAANSGGTGTAVLILTVSAVPVTAPVITSASSATAKVDQAFTYQITASHTPASFAASGLPAGLTVSTATGEISGTPAVAGVFAINLSATNSSGTGTAGLTLTVTAAPMVIAPVLTSVTAAEAEKDKEFSYQIAADNVPVSFNATGLPEGLKVDSATGRISGKPLKIGSFRVELSARNAAGKGTEILSLTVSSSPVPAPVITNAAGDSAKLNEVFTCQIAATNEPTSFAASGLPPGLTVSTATGLISGAPTALGTFSVTLHATNSGGTDTRSLSLFVAESLPVATLVATKPTVTAGSDRVGEFTVRLSPKPTRAVVVHFKIKGTAVNGTDYELLTDTRKIKPGEASRPIKITPLTGAAGPGSERTVVLTLQPGDGYEVGTKEKATVKILGR